MVDGKKGLVALPEGDREIADVEKRRAHWKVLRGSSESRTASPMKPSHGACRFCLPWLRSSPSEGDPGGRPKPRKSSAVSVVTDPDRMKGMKVTVEIRALGKRCLNMIFVLVRPSALAARTYSKLRARRNSARTTPSSDVQENSTRMNSSSQKVGVMKAARMISR